MPTRFSSKLIEHTYSNIDATNLSVGMKLLVLTLLTLAADYVCAFGIMNPRNTPLKIKLTPLSNSKLHVAARNTGSQGYNLFHTASILDGEAPVDKLMIHRAGKIFPLPYTSTSSPNNKSSNARPLPRRIRTSLNHESQRNTVHTRQTRPNNRNRDRHSLTLRCRSLRPLYHSCCRLSRLC